jgi:hypothetical protein
MERQLKDGATLIHLSAQVLETGNKDAQISLGMRQD